MNQLIFIIPFISSFEIDHNKVMIPVSRQRPNKYIFVIGFMSLKMNMGFVMQVIDNLNQNILNQAGCDVL